MKRIVDLSDQTGLEIELLNLPPYHSKYNPFERFWGVLEQHWNGTLLSSVSLVLNWAQTATWRGTCPIIQQITNAYHTGVVIGPKPSAISAPASNATRSCQSGASQPPHNRYINSTPLP